MDKDMLLFFGGFGSGSSGGIETRGFLKCMWRSEMRPDLLLEPCFVKGVSGGREKTFGELVKIGWSEIFDCSSLCIIWQLIFEQWF